jgi:hypothetical protein
VDAYSFKRSRVTVYICRVLSSPNFEVFTVSIPMSRSMSPNVILMISSARALILSYIDKKGKVRAHMFKQMNHST